MGFYSGKQHNLERSKMFPRTGMGMDTSLRNTSSQVFSKFILHFQGHTNAMKLWNQYFHTWFLSHFPMFPVADMQWWMWGDWLPLRRSNPSRGSYMEAGRCKEDRGDLTSNTGSVSVSRPLGSGEEHNDDDDWWGRDNPACWMMLRSSLFSRTKFWT